MEKTKRSYYDIRMQLKYQLRIPIMELIEKVLPLEAPRLAPPPVARVLDACEVSERIHTHHICMHMILHQ